MALPLGPRDDETRLPTRVLYQLVSGQQVRRRIAKSKRENLTQQRGVFLRLRATGNISTDSAVGRDAWGRYRCVRIGDHRPNAGDRALFKIGQHRHTVTTLLRNFRAEPPFERRQRRKRIGPLYAVLVARLHGDMTVLLVDTIFVQNVDEIRATLLRELSLLVARGHAA